VVGEPGVVWGVSAECGVSELRILQLAVAEKRTNGGRAVGVSELQAVSVLLPCGGGDESSSAGDIGTSGMIAVLCEMCYKQT